MSVCEKDFSVIVINLMWRDGAAGSVADSQLQGLWFDPELGLLTVWSFACSPASVWVSPRSGFLPPPKNLLVGELAMLNCLQI